MKICLVFECKGTNGDRLDLELRSDNSLAVAILHGSDYGMSRTIIERDGIEKLKEFVKQLP